MKYIQKISIRAYFDLELALCIYFQKMSETCLFYIDEDIRRILVYHSTNLNMTIEFMYIYKKVKNPDLTLITVCNVLSSSITEQIAPSAR